MNTQFDERSEDYANARSGNLAALFASLLGGSMPAAGQPGPAFPNGLADRQPGAIPGPVKGSIPMPIPRPPMQPGYSSFGVGTADRQAVGPAVPSPGATVDLLRRRGPAPGWMTPRG
jgi:hypothetical protein